MLQNLSPIGVSQVAQGIDSGGVSPEAAAIMAILGLNPRYTNPTTTPGTSAASGATRGAVTVKPVPMTSQTSQPIKVAPVKER